jgi:hypothetical protein
VGSETETAHISAPHPTGRVRPGRPTGPIRARAYARRVGDGALALTVALGVVLRLRQYLHARSLWFDELFLATNVRDRGMVGLTKQLSLSQAAPLGFLWSAKLSIVAFGQHELAYRLVPVASGIASVVLVALVARRLFTPPAALAAVAVIALAGQSILKSSEFKQYTLEAAVAALLLLTASYCIGSTMSDDLRHPELLAVIGALGLVCAVSAAFVLGGIAVVLVAQTVRSRRYERYVTLAVIGLSWAATAAVMYVVSWSNDAHNPKLHGYWKAYFGPAPWAHPGWYVSSWNEMIGHQVAISWSAAAIGLTVAGVTRLAFRAPAIATIAVVTVLCTVTASWAGLYPFNGRLLLFLVPIVCLFLGAVVDAVVDAVARLPGTRSAMIGSLVGLACAVGLVSGSIGTARATFDHPFEYEETRQVLEALRPRFRPGERLVVADSAALAFGFYRDRTGFADVPIVLQAPGDDRIPNFLRQVDRLGPGLTWILFDRLHPGPDIQNPDTVRNREAIYFSTHIRGRIVGSIRATGAWAVEIDQTR